MEILGISRHFCSLSTLWIGPRLREDIDIFKFPVAPRQGLRLPTRRFENGVRLIEHDICWNLTWHVYHSSRHLHPYLHLCTRVQVRTFLLYMNTHFFSFLYECTRMSEYWGFWLVLRLVWKEGSKLWCSYWRIPCLEFSDQQGHWGLAWIVFGVWLREATGKLAFQCQVAWCGSTLRNHQRGDEANSAGSHQLHGRSW